VAGAMKGPFSIVKTSFASAKGPFLMQKRHSHCNDDCASTGLLHAKSHLVITIRLRQLSYSILYCN